MKRIARILLSVLTVCVLGCGSGNDRIDISGTVTYKGQPVSRGRITFDPDTSRGHTGVQGSADIIDGQLIVVPNMGPAPGPHIARVTAYDGLVVEEKGSGIGRVLFADVQVPVDIVPGARTVDIDVPRQPSK